jgi:hypothetical protein
MSSLDNNKNITTPIDIFTPTKLVVTPKTPFNTPEIKYPLKIRTVCAECTKDGCMNCYKYGMFCSNCRRWCLSKSITDMTWEFFYENAQGNYPVLYEQFFDENVIDYSPTPLDHDNDS